MKDIVATQRLFFNSHTTKDIQYRILQLECLEQTLNSNIEILDKAIYDDFKKSSFENYLTEIGIVLHDIKQAKGNFRVGLQKRELKQILVIFLQPVTPSLSRLASHSLLVPGIILITYLWLQLLPLLLLEIQLF